MSSSYGIVPCSMLLLPFVAHLGCAPMYVQPGLEELTVINRTESQAKERVRSSFGRLGEQALLSARRVSLGTQTVPFLADDLKQKETWELELTNVEIRQKDGRKNPHITTLTTWLAPTTGQIMKVVSKWPVELEPTLPAPPIEIEAEQMARTGIRFTGLPATPPQISLTDAITLAMGGAANAKELIAYYVLYSSEINSIFNQPVWVVQLRGLPPFIPPVPRGFDVKSIPVEARNHLSTFVDAETGEFIFANNVPQPVTD